MNDAAMLAEIPEYITLGSAFLKAVPAEEAGERFLYMEASNEDPDHQHEVVLQKALEDSASYFLRHGNIDLSHYTLLGPKAGIANHYEYEIGKPVDVRVQGDRTFVKAQLYKGDSAMARNANMVWDSLTKQSPPARWYPSVGGAVLGILGLVGIFAEVLAAPAPLLVVGHGMRGLLPAITEERVELDVPDKRYEGTFVVWPIVRSSPTAITDEGPFAPSSATHPLGTDEKGRDVFARIVYGARNALGVSVVAIFLSTLFGVLLGGLSGIRGGVSRTVLVRLVETVDSFPAIIVVALVWAIERQPSSLSLILAARSAPLTQDSRGGG